jgi:hypothetical protein
MLQHAPAGEVVVEIAHRSRQRIRVRAYDAFERVVAETSVPPERDAVHRLSLEGQMITHVHVDGGAEAAELLRYCLRPVRTGSPATPAQGSTPGIDVGRLECIAFGQYGPNQVFPSPHQFGDVTIADNRNVNLQIASWLDNEPNSLYFAREGLTVMHPAARRVVLRAGHYTGEPVTVQAFNAAGDLLDEVVKRTPNRAEVLRLTGEGIVRVVIAGGGNEAILVQYCFERADREPPDRNWMRCFRGSMDLPQDAPAGRWIVYLAVQNINHVPAGVAPESAATVIGGHVMGPIAQVLGCGFMLLGDHVFDIF